MTDLPEPEPGSFPSPRIWHPQGGTPQEYFVFCDHPTRGLLGSGPFNRDTASKVEQEWRQQIAEGQKYEKRYRAAKRRHGHQKKPKRRTTHQRELRERLEGFTYPLPSIQSGPQSEECRGSPFTAKPIPPTREEVTAWQQEVWDASEAYLEEQKRRRMIERNRCNLDNAKKTRERIAAEKKARAKLLWDALGRDGVPERNRPQKVAKRFGVSTQQARRITDSFRIDRTDKKPSH